MDDKSISVTIRNSVTIRYMPIQIPNPEGLG
jgi:hypothetical protein